MTAAATPGFARLRPDAVAGSATDAETATAAAAEPRVRRVPPPWRSDAQPAEPDCTLTPQRIYILPTRAGAALAITLAVMLLASINYQLALGYALTFWLGAAALVSMLQTHANLRGLHLHLRPVAAVVAGESFEVDLVLASPGRARPGIGIGWQRRGRHGLSFLDVPARGTALGRLRDPAPRRGSHAVPMVRIETWFPLGLFRAWALWRPQQEALAYPRPEQPPPPWPGRDADHAPGARRLGAPQVGFEGLRPWRRGDSLRQIAWKKVARTGEWVSLEPAAAPKAGLVLDWAAAGPGDDEARLSRLAAWVLQAEAQGRAYALSGPGLHLPRGLGDAQRLAALRALATWGEACTAEPAARGRVA